MGRKHRIRQKRKPRKDRDRHREQDLLTEIQAGKYGPVIPGVLDVFDMHDMTDGRVFRDDTEFVPSYPEFGERS